MSESELKDKINNFELLLADLEFDSNDSRESWQLRKEIFTDFKEVRFNLLEERQRCWDKFQSLVNVLREKQDEINKENQDFADDVNAMLTSIEELIEEIQSADKKSKEQFEQIKQQLFDAFEFLKQPKWPTKEIRIESWEKYNALRKILKEEEDGFYSDIREKRTKRIEYSNELLEQTLRTIDACQPHTPVEDLFDLLGKLLLYLTGIGFILDFIEWIFGADDKPVNPLKVKSQALNDIRKFINDNKEDIVYEDKQKIYARLDIVKAELDEAWADYKEELNRKRQEREAKKEEWERKQRDFLEKLELNLANQIAFKEKLEGILEKQESFLENLEKRLENQEDYLKKVNEQLEELEEKYNNAYSDNFKEKASGWIEEKKAKIEEVEDSIGQLKDKIREIENSIGELSKRITKISTDIDNIEEKINEVNKRLNN